MKHVTVTMTFTVPDDADLDEIFRENAPLIAPGQDQVIDEHGRRIGSVVVTVAAERETPPAPLTAPQRDTLAALRGYSNGRSAGAVARALGHDSATNAARVLDRLVDRGLVQTWTTATDRRRWALIPE